MKEERMFKVTGDKGFHIKFHNGYEISVQFGHGNYCDSKARTCEVAVFKGDLYVDLPDSMDDGWVTPEKLVKIMDWVSNREAD